MALALPRNFVSISTFPTRKVSALSSIRGERAHVLKNMIGTDAAATIKPTSSENGNAITNSATGTKTAAP
jgi:hypothetical protein